MSTKNPNSTFSTQNEAQPSSKHPFSNSNNDKNEITLRDRDLTSPIANNKSYIDPDDAPSPEWDVAGMPSKWKRLELWNRGIHNGKWSDQQKRRNQDDWYICRNIACQLGLSSEMKQVLWQIFKSLDLRSFRKYESKRNQDYHIQPISTENKLPSIRSIKEATTKQYLVVFAICALLYNQNRSDHQEKYYPGKEPEQRKRYAVQCRYARSLVNNRLYDCHELLHQFAQHIGFSDGLIRSCMEKLRQDCVRLN